MLVIVSSHQARRHNNKTCTYRFFADNHLLNAHDLSDMVRPRFELALSDAFIDASQKFGIHVVAGVDACTVTDDQWHFMSYLPEITYHFSTSRNPLIPRWKRRDYNGKDMHLQLSILPLDQVSCRTAASWVPMTKSNCCVKNRHCDIQPRPQVAHPYCSAEDDSAFCPEWNCKMSISFQAK